MRRLLFGLVLAGTSMMFAAPAMAEWHGGHEYYHDGYYHHPHEVVGFYAGPRTVYAPPVVEYVPTPAPVVVAQPQPVYVTPAPVVTRVPAASFFYHGPHFSVGLGL